MRGKKEMDMFRCFKLADDLTNFLNSQKNVSLSEIIAVMQGLTVKIAHNNGMTYEEYCKAMEYSIKEWKSLWDCNE